MSGISVGFTIFACLLALMAFRVPIGIAMFVAGSGGAFDDLAGFRASLATPPPQLVLRIVRGNVQGTLAMQ